MKTRPGAAHGPSGFYVVRSHCALIPSLIRLPALWRARTVGLSGPSREHPQLPAGCRNRSLPHANRPLSPHGLGHGDHWPTASGLVPLAHSLPLTSAVVPAAPQQTAASSALAERAAKRLRWGGPVLAVSVTALDLSANSVATEGGTGERWCPFQPRLLGIERCARASRHARRRRRAAPDAGERARAYVQQAQVVLAFSSASSRSMPRRRVPLAVRSWTDCQ